MKNKKKEAKRDFQYSSVVLYAPLKDPNWRKSTAMQLQYTSDKYERNNFEMIGKNYLLVDSSEVWVPTWF